MIIVMFHHKREQYANGQIPFPAPGIRFEVTAGCKYTASQESGHVVLIPSPTITGVVF